MSTSCRLQVMDEMKYALVEEDVSVCMQMRHKFNVVWTTAEEAMFKVHSFMTLHDEGCPYIQSANVL